MNMAAPAARHIAVTPHGIRIDLDAPDPGMIFAVDIAEGLSNITRWNGATRPSAFSTAQHSVLVADEMYRIDGPLAALYGLLHDGHEYIIGDVSRTTEAWVRCGTALDAGRFKLDRAIHASFDLDWPPPASIARLLDRAHDSVVLAEMRDLCRGREPEIAMLEARNVTRIKTIIRPRALPITCELWLARCETYSAAAGIGLHANHAIRAGRSR
jgi:hypothetical protein